MKTVNLSRRFLPATLFLIAVGLRGQTADTAADPSATDSSSTTETAPAAAPANPRLTPKEQELLKRFDTNGDGKLDDDELAAAHDTLHQEEMGKAVQNAQRIYTKLLDKFDTEKKGSLNPAQQEAAVSFIETNNKYIFQKLLQKFDKNGDGKLDAAELQTMFDTLSQAPKFQQAAKTLSEPPTATAKPGNANRQMMVRKIYDRLLANFDKDHDGSLSADEQVAALTYLKANNPYIFDKMVTRFGNEKDGTIDPTQSQKMFDTLAALPEATPVPPPAADKEKS